MVLLVGTDCSGIETPLVALGRLGVPHRHAFSSERCPGVRRYIERNFGPEQLYGDIRERPACWPEQLDLYVAGPPCTAASKLNRNQPEEARDDAYDVCRRCFAFIAASRPHCFVVENVLPLRKVRGGAVWAELMAAVPPVYEVEARTLHPSEHGCPQHRPRLYVVGVRRDNPHGWAVRWPAPRPLPVSADGLLSPAGPAGRPLAPVQRAFVAAHVDGDSAHVVNIQNTKTTVRLHGAWKRPRDDRCSQCLTRHDPVMYSARLRRPLHPLEHARLQGFLDGEVDVAHPRIAGMIGNAMNATVLHALLAAVMGLPAPGPAHLPQPAEAAVAARAAADSAAAPQAGP